jgi:hypothetical protein
VYRFPRLVSRWSRSNQKAVEGRYPTALLPGAGCQNDRARFGDVGVPATDPFTQDEETSGVIDVSSILGAGNYLLVDQARYPINSVTPDGFPNPNELVEGQYVNTGK